MVHLPSRASKVSSTVYQFFVKIFLAESMYEKMEIILQAIKVNIKRYSNTIRKSKQISNSVRKKLA